MKMPKAKIITERKEYTAYQIITTDIKYEAKHRLFLSKA